MRTAAIKMLTRGINIVDIMEVTGLTEEEILQIQDEKMERVKKSL